MKKINRFLFKNNLYKPLVYIVNIVLFTGSVYTLNKYANSLFVQLCLMYVCVLILKKINKKLK